MPTRYASLDYIRGLSILGILIVNAIDFAQPMVVYSSPAMSPVAMTAADGLAYWAVETFAHEKFVTLFSLLFGVSVFLVGEGGDKPLLRRLLWLGVFGLIHGALIWHGDILLLYAVTGLVFMWWRDWTARRLLLTGAAIYFAGGIALFLVTLVYAATGVGSEIIGNVGQMVAWVRSGFAGSLHGNFQQWQSIIIAEIIGFLPVTLSLMMIGLGLFKTGFFKGESPAWVYALSLIAAAVSLVIVGALKARFVANGYSAEGFASLYEAAGNVLPLIIALGYASVLILLTRLAVVRGLLYPLQCAGRMAFTNYLTQSLVMTALFFGGRAPAGLSETLGLPWYGQMNIAALVPIVATIWVTQLIVSTVWMSLFRYGPFEWVWRCLTHQRLVAITK